YRTLNPSTGELEGEFPLASGPEVEEVLDRSERGFQVWRGLPLERRGRLFHAVADRLSERKGSLALLMTTEMGKPIKEAQAEIDKCALACRFYADHAGGYLEAEPRSNDRQTGEVVYRPLGAVLAIMPWNFPFW